MMCGTVLHLLKPPLNVLSGRAAPQVMSRYQSCLSCQQWHYNQCLHWVCKYDDYVSSYS